MSTQIAHGTYVHIKRERMNHMTTKRLFAALLAGAFALSLTACSEESAATDDNASGSEAAQGPLRSA